MTAEQRATGQGIQEPLLPPFSPKRILLPTVVSEKLKPNDDVAQWHAKLSQPLPSDYLTYLSGLEAEWKNQEALARVDNPYYIASLQEKETSRQEVAQRLLVEVPKNGEETKIPIEVRNFRFWQKSLWLNEEFRKVTKGHGFMEDFDIRFCTRQRTFHVQYRRSENSELLLIETERVVSERELEAIRNLYGERTFKNGNENENKNKQTPRKKHADKSIQSVVQKHTIQLVISKHEGLSSTYLQTERFINRQNSSVPDFYFNPEDGFVMDEQGKKFVGWLTIVLLQ